MPKKSVFLSIFLMAVVLPFQQCTDVRLSPKSTHSNLEQSLSSVLPPPSLNEFRLRLLIFVDQSYSMIQGKCPTDLDGSQPRGDFNASGCFPEPGVDPGGDRFAAIEQWLEELSALGGEDPEAIKVALIPFSGGSYARPRDDEPKELYEFQTLEQTRARLQDLRTEQALEINALPKETPYVGGVADPLYMGTTASITTLKYMNSVVKEELDQLKDSNTLEITPLKMVYISDGVFKPLQVHWDWIWEKSGCRENPGYILCSDLKQDFMEDVGDVTENSYPNTIAAFRSLLQNRLDYPQSNISLQFVKIHPELVPSSEQNNSRLNNEIDYLNLFDDVRESLKMDLRVDIYNQFSSQAPFSILGGSEVRTYVIDRFYIVHLNRFINDSGMEVVDSDGDGIGDGREEELGSNPYEARTNGVCLDSITEQFGCRLIGCQADVDNDGDGLNACEEQALGTSDLRVDTDGDGILDPHEALRGLSPLINSWEIYSSSDHVDEGTHFIKGTRPYTDLRKVSEALLIHFNLAEEAPVEMRDDWGRTIQVASYNINSISVPLVKTGHSQGYPPDIHPSSMEILT